MRHRTVVGGSGRLDLTGIYLYKKNAGGDPLHPDGHPGAMRALAWGGLLAWTAIVALLWLGA